MPVPVPVSHLKQQSAHPVLKHHFQHQSLSKPRQDGMQGFNPGLALADSVFAIKAALAQARLPPDTMLAWDSPTHGCSPDESPDVPSSPIGPLTPLSLDLADQRVASQLVGQQSKWPQNDQVQASSEVATPSASPAYRKLAEYFSDWIARFVWKVCTQGLALPETFSRPGPYHKQYNPDLPPSYLAGSIHSLLLSTLLEPSAILLAMWYIVRLPVFFASAPLALDRERETLFRLELFGDPTALDRDATENAAPFRLVVLGFMLSNKWLSDHTYSNKTWHTISNISVGYLNRLELLVLSIFQHDLSVSDQNWSNWLDFIMLYHSETASPVPEPISRPSSNPRVVIRRSVEDIILAIRSRSTSCGLPQPMFLDLEERRREQMAKEAAITTVYPPTLDDDGLMKQEFHPRNHASQLAPGVSNHVGGECLNRTFFDSGKPLPPPAKWSPAADEPILRDTNRTHAHYLAPGAIATFPTYTSYPAIYEQTREPSLVPNWPGYIAPPVKQVMPAGYGPDCLSHFPPAYQIPFVSSLPPHSRSQSLSYGQENHMSLRNLHLRSLSQTQPDTRCSHDSRELWWDSCSSIPPVQPIAPVLAPIYNNVAYTQASWLPL